MNNLAQTPKPGSLPRPKPVAKPRRPLKSRPLHPKAGLKKHAKELLQQLIHLQDRFPQPEFEDILKKAQAGVQRIVGTSHTNARDRVLKSLENGASMIDEIIDETDLSDWMVRRALDFLVKSDLVEARIKRDPERVQGAAVTHLYILK